MSIRRFLFSIDHLFYRKVLYSNTQNIIRMMKKLHVSEIKSWRRLIFLIYTELYTENVGEGTLPWATPCLGPSRFLLNEKKKNIFRLMHIALFLKVTY